MINKDAFKKLNDNKYSVFTMELFDVDDIVTSKFIKDLREKLNLSITIFASLCSTTSNVIKKWEAGTKIPSEIEKKFLYCLSVDESIIKHFIK